MDFFRAKLLQFENLENLFENKLAKQQKKIIFASRIIRMLNYKF